jgi:fructose-bisphosphate aldolase class I
MHNEELATIAKRLVTPPKGILAIDESTETCTKRFEKLGIESTEENRRAYRELLITTPLIEEYISGMIMVDETIRQHTKEGKPFLEIFKEKGMEAGIKVDGGLEQFGNSPIEKITKGLEGLPERLQHYKSLGVTFAKWRAVYFIKNNLPSDELIAESTIRLVKYAKMCQEVGIVPIVEPEVLMTGEHTLEQTEKVISDVLDVLFIRLAQENIYMPGLLLKTGMVVPGEKGEKATPEQVAEATLRCLEDYVPKDIGGVVLLSGGLDEESATLYLNALHKTEPLPWPLTFSYGRALQNPALTLWAKDMENIQEAQKALLARARANSEASVGSYV